MATATTLRPRFDLDVGPRVRRRALLGARAAARVPAGSTRPTLDELLVGAWEGLRSGHVVACPVCSGAMTPRGGPGPRPTAGRCLSCGSELD